MSTTDTRAAFEEVWPEIHSAGKDHGWRGIAMEAWDAALKWQAATEAAKATGTAGEIAEKVECPRCKGTGESSLDAALNWGEHKCADCSGKGFYWEPTEAARQPAPALPVKRWEDRANEAIASGASIDHFNGFRDAEIADLRAALAAAAAPVLSDDLRMKLNACIETCRALEILSRQEADTLLVATRSQP